MAFRDLKLQRKVHNNVNYLDKVQKVGYSLYFCEIKILKQGYMPICEKNDKVFNVFGQI